MEPRTKDFGDGPRISSRDLARISASTAPP